MNADALHEELEQVELLEDATYLIPWYLCNLWVLILNNTNVREKGYNSNYFS